MPQRRLHRSLEWIFRIYLLYPVSGVSSISPRVIAQASLGLQSCEQGHKWSSGFDLGQNRPRVTLCLRPCLKQFHDVEAGLGGKYVKILENAHEASLCYVRILLEFWHLNTTPTEEGNNVLQKSRKENRQMMRLIMWYQMGKCHGAYSITISRKNTSNRSRYLLSSLL